MNRLKTEKRKAVVAALVEGNSIRATCRMTGVAKNTVTKLLRDLGDACSEYQDRAFRNLSCKRIQVDEIWSFVYSKAKNVPAEKQCEMVGDVWTWVAIDADTKLVPTFMVGKRDAGAATAFLADLKSRLAHRVQLTSDGHSPYLNAVDDTFGDDIDYAMLVKYYGRDGNPKRPDARYSPGRFNGARSTRIKGNPDRDHVSTSYVERQNLTMRMHMRRFTRLTNGFSKKAENLIHAVALHFMYYNYCKKHQTLGMTPAEAAGLVDHQWSIEELLGILDSN